MLVVPPPTRAKCLYCGLVITPKQGQLYCNKDCKKSAAKARKAKRELVESKPVGCPTPEKRKFATEKAAIGFKPIYGRIPYLCPCGWYHNKTPKGRK